MKGSEGLSSHRHFHLLHCGINKKGINDVIRGGFDFKAASEAARAILGKNGRVMSQSQAAAERMLDKHNRKEQLVDITLGMTKKQMDNCDKELAAIARRDEELDQEYNFEGGHLVNPGNGHKDEGTAITLAMRISLGDTAYDVEEWEDELSLGNLEVDLYKDNQGTGGIDFKMEQVHHNVGRKIATPHHQKRVAVDHPPNQLTETKKILTPLTVMKAGVRVT